MPKMCKHNIPEVKKGSGPCDIRYEVMKRNGKPNWWCRTHGHEASAPDGAALESCPAAWFDPVSDDRQLDIDVRSGEISIWGVVAPAIQLGDCAIESGTVHVHRRSNRLADKDLDNSFDIVRVTNGAAAMTVDGMAAVAYSISELAGVEVRPLECPHCHEIHIDELRFATHGHIKHLCNSCGRNFRDTRPSISNPLGGAQDALGLQEPTPPARVSRPIALSSAEFGGVALWPSNSAIITTVERPEDIGVHVHAWTQDGTLIIDETYSPVTLDGEVIDEDALRLLAVQRALADGAPIVSIACRSCGHALSTSAETWIEPTTTHVCSNCGEATRTRRRVFVNPLAEKFIG